MQISFKCSLKLVVFVALLLTSIIYAAVRFTQPAQTVWGHIAPLELQNSDLGSGTIAYRGWFESGAWQGDLIEYDVNSDADLSTSIDLSGTSPAQGSPADNWSAHVQFASAVDDDSDYWTDTRKIITYDSSSQMAFRWGNLSAAQQTALGGSNVLDFIRGSQTNESNGGFRQRLSILGDMVHSNPAYVKVPQDGYTDTSYTDFVNANDTERAARVYVGANDGMLHAFDAETGNEKWAYVPSMVINNLKHLKTQPYVHNYYVDGAITVQDAYFDPAGGSDDEWRTVLLSSLGAGGQGMFALDITNEDLSDETENSGDDKKVLWELDASNNDMGYIFGKPVIAQLNDDNWYAINGNGVNSVNGIAKLFLTNIETGVVTSLTTGSGSAASPNGLASPAVILGNDGKVDLVYAGDNDGDLWRFDLSGDDASDWASGTTKLYSGDGVRPITTTPDVGSHPSYGYMVLFGTGRLYTQADEDDQTTKQGLFGIWDDLSGGTMTDSCLLSQTLSSDATYTSNTISESVRTVSNNAITWSGDDANCGWDLFLPAVGERLLAPLQLRAGRVQATVTNPTGRENWLIEIDYQDGSGPDSAIYDLDGSDVLDDDDYLDVAGDDDPDIDGSTDDNLPPAALRLADGAMSQPTIGYLSGGSDTLFFNFLNPPPEPPACSGNCTGGIAGGHFDLDHDTPNNGLGGSTKKHVHEYDDDYNRTYADYLDLTNTGFDEDVDNSIVASDVEFIVLIANAELSTGATLTIGSHDYNAVEYQVMLQKALQGWDGSDGGLVDDNSHTLIHDLTDILAETTTTNGVTLAGTLRTTFSDQAIKDGGLMPTETGCVKDNATPTKGRWRNGALTIQLIRRDHFTAAAVTAAGNALELLTVQDLDSSYYVLDEVILSDGSKTVQLTEDYDLDDIIEPYYPDYERFSGLRVDEAGDNAEFLYESTLFWHYQNEDRALLRTIFGVGGTACYGDDVWADAAFLASNFTQAEYDAWLLTKGVVGGQAGLASYSCPAPGPAFEYGPGPGPGSVLWALAVTITKFEYNYDEEEFKVEATTDDSDAVLTVNVNGVDYPMQDKGGRENKWEYKVNNFDYTDLPDSVTVSGSGSDTLADLHYKGKSLPPSTDDSEVGDDTVTILEAKLKYHPDGRLELKVTAKSSDTDNAVLTLDQYWGGTWEKEGNGEWELKINDYTGALPSSVTVTSDLTGTATQTFNIEGSPSASSGGGASTSNTCLTAEELADLAAVAAYIVASTNPPAVDADADGDTDPFIMMNNSNIGDGVNQSGPNFTTGRRTWTDISPE